MVYMTIIDTAREAARETDGRFGPQEHTEPEFTLALEVEGETEAMAEERGISDARQLRTPTPGFYADAYMAGYESELLDLGDSWED